MQPNQSMPGAMRPMGVNGVQGMPSRPSAMSQPAMESAAPQTEIKEKDNKGMLIGLMFCILLAIGGIGFGVWAMMDGNAQKDDLNSQISTLKAQNNEMLAQIADLQSTIEDYKNNENKEESGTVLVEWGTAEAEVVEGVFYIKDKDGKTVAQDDSVKVLEIVSCDSGTVDSPSPLVCSVTTVDGQGKFVYSYDDGTLTFTAVESEPTNTNN